MLKELFQNGGKMQAKQVHIEPTRGTDPDVKCKCKLMIIVVNALSYPWYCLTTDQLFHRRATQTNETNIANEK